MAPEIHTVTQVTTTRRERETQDTPTVTFSARVAVSATADVRVTARPIVASMADAMGVPHLEIHTVDGTSFTLDGPPLASLIRDALKFLRQPTLTPGFREHDFVYGLRATFDLTMGPFTVVEQPPFEVAHATTHVHPSGNVALLLRGTDRARERMPFHAPASAPEADVRPAFEVQLTAKRAAWLASLLEEASEALGAHDDREPSSN